MRRHKRISIYVADFYFILRGPWPNSLPLIDPPPILPPLRTSHLTLGSFSVLLGGVQSWGWAGNAQIEWVFLSTGLLMDNVPLDFSFATLQPNSVLLWGEFVCPSQV